MLELSRGSRGETFDREDNPPHWRLAGPVSGVDDPGDGAVTLGDWGISPYHALLVFGLLTVQVVRMNCTSGRDGWEER